MNTTKFTTRACDAMGYYVYCLIDPRDNKVTLPSVTSSPIAINPNLFVRDLDESLNLYIKASYPAFKSRKIKQLPMFSNFQTEKITNKALYITVFLYLCILIS